VQLKKKKIAGILSAATCTEAGILSTLAMMQGKEAEQFLDQQDTRYWCYC